MAHFIAGDSPASEFDYVLPDDALVDGVTYTLAVRDQTLSAVETADGVVGLWTGLETSVPGIYPVYVVQTAQTGTQRFLADYLVIDPDTDADWHTLDSARAAWRDAPTSDGELYALLQTARDQCEAFAPALSTSAPVPDRYRQAQIMQARNLYNAVKSDPSGVFDDGSGLVVRTFPMDWTVKNILRPKRAVPRLG